ncbi:virulence factor [Paenibacillus swuensis]|uniref:Virulence factor n=1 Tax=Paenibacillus swuensis TaxID=1178515 RepID=A0A172TF89_9BACL|nr:virulence factor [Paenibacillus swuensis]ANE45622.1 virulence factor [Paenibacillus swuensis]
MKIISIEPTPSPNSMKLNMDESLPQGIRHTYTPAEAAGAPENIRLLLAVEGVKSIYHTADFIALDRKPNADWPSILAEAGKILGGDGGAGAGGASSGGNEGPGEAGVGSGSGVSGAGTGASVAGTGADAFGEVQVKLQTFRGLPLQLRVRSGAQEHRAAMPERFAAAVQRAAGASMITERMLGDLGVRYGELTDVAAEVLAELDAAYSSERLEELVQRAIELGPQAAAERPARPAALTLAEATAAMDAPASTWQQRYAALEQLKPSSEALPLLARALRDENTSVRRLATVYLGDIGAPDALPHLFAALRDRTPSVRRTAGDTLSDIGSPAAIGPMTEALRDANKLVRWRAARFLYELGDASSLPALREAAEDAEFEVSLQAKMAIERIESGEEAAGTVWQQMTNRSKD